MDLLQLLDRDLGVNLGGREFGMAKELLDKADIRAAFKHLGGASVVRFPHLCFAGSIFQKRLDQGLSRNCDLN
jgi:hypothetical protein